MKDVPRVAKAGEIKDVADGYGSNYLLPKKLALVATQSAIKTAERQIQRDKEKEQKFAAELGQLAEQLKGYTLTFTGKVLDEERIYGSVRDSDIADKLRELTGADVDRKSIDLPEPLRTLGEHEVSVRLNKDLVPTIKVVIVGEE